MVGIVEPDHQASGAPLVTLLHVHQHTSAAVRQPVKGVNIVDQDDFTPYLELQLVQERSVLDTPCLVRFELSHSSAGILGLDGEELSLNLVQLGIVSGVDLGVGAIDVQGVGVQGGVRLGPNSGLQQGNVLFSLSATCMNLCSRLC